MQLLERVSLQRSCAFVEGLGQDMPLPLVPVFVDAITAVATRARAERTLPAGSRNPALGDGIPVVRDGSAVL